MILFRFAGSAPGSAAADVLFTGTYTGGIVLADPAAQNPATIAAGGYVTNTGGSHNGDAIYGTDAAAWSVTNLGVVRSTRGGSDGIHLAAGGYVANGPGALVAGADAAVRIEGAAGNVVNNATLQGTGNAGDGVLLLAGGAVGNAASGLIAGPQFGIYVGAAAGAVTNYGTIAGTGSRYAGGVSLAAGGTLANLGVITATAGSSGVGVNVGYGSVTNGAGALIAGSDVGLELGGSYGAAVNYGAISGGADGVVSKAAATAVTNFGQIAGTARYGYGVYLYAGGYFTNAAGASVSGYHTVIVTHAAASIANYGNISAAGDNSIAIELLTAGNVVVNAGTLADPAGAAFSFGSGNDVLVVEPGAVFDGVIARFQPSEAIDLANTPATDLVYTGNYAGGTLSVLDGGVTVASFSLSGQFTPDEFLLGSDGAGGSAITLRQPGQPIVAGVYYDTILLGYGALGAVATVTASGMVAAAFGHGVRAAGGEIGHLTNAGTITALERPVNPALSTGDGVYLNAGGSVMNLGASGGMIAGYVAGVALGGGTGRIVNSGMIAATGYSGFGILLGAGGNAAAATVGNSGVIAGATGVMAAGGARNTVTNAGAIIGYGGTAVALAGGRDRLVVEPGAYFSGIADGGGGQSVLELGGAPASASAGSMAATGTLSGLGSEFTDFQMLAVDSSAEWQLSGIARQVTNNGIILVADAADLSLGALVAASGASGVVQVAGYAVADFTAAVSATQRIEFADATGAVLIDNPRLFRATIAGFAVGDMIDLTTVAADTASFANGRLTLSANGATVATLKLAGSFAGSAFVPTPDGNGGTDIALAPAADFVAAGAGRVNTDLRGIGSGWAADWAMRA